MTGESNNESSIYKMDTSFIGRPHYTDPRRVYSTTGTDYQDRVNFDRLRKGRLERAKQMMEKHDLGALVLFQGANIRYVTASYQATGSTTFSSAMRSCRVVASHTSSRPLAVICSAPGSTCPGWRGAFSPR